MSLKILDTCIGCGGCELPCPHGAISQVDEFVVRFTVDPILCNDCGICVPLCPEDSLVDDVTFAICHGRGCPMTAARMTAWSCSEGIERCEDCGAMLWRGPGQDRYECPRCDLGRKAICPKTRKLESFAAT